MKKGTLKQSKLNSRIATMTGSFSYKLTIIVIHLIPVETFSV